MQINETTSSEEKLATALYARAATVRALAVSYDLGTTSKTTTIAAGQSRSFSGSSDGKSTVNVKGSVVNNGTINITGISLLPFAASSITGTGTINLKNVQLRGNSKDPSYYSLMTVAGQTINMENSSLSVQRSLSNTTINLKGSNNYIAFNFQSGVVDLRIRGLSQGDVLYVWNGNGANSFSYNASTGILTITQLTKTIRLDIGLGYDPNGFTNANSFNGNRGVSYTKAAPCFLTGTLIATPSGERPVETLTSGDLVMAMRDGVLHPCAVVRIHEGWQTPSSVLPECWANFPVRIRAEAFGKNAPHRDLLVTPEHCVHFDGKRVPARTLINNDSVIYEKNTDAYRYFGIELEKHEFIIANGLVVESYLTAPPPTSRGAQSSALSSTADMMRPLPLDASSPFLASIFALYGHAAQLSKQHGARDLRTAGLCLTTEDGRVIPPHFVDERRATFGLPAHTRTVVLHSRIFVPAVDLGAYIDDRRTLGVLVGRIRVGCDREGYDLDGHLQTETVEGWHEVETPTCRWTNGAAFIHLPSPVEARGSQMTITLLGSPPDDNRAPREHASVSMA
ncbi:Hint domain-containing protein [Asaia sp. BMEF1]|uniref:Hint domain-containing protein n=1 Tax=Asaia sp. BMEF1 TaxID=3155932 RepID=UPI003F667E7E